MKKLAVVTASLTLFAMASCVTHKTCPTYMKNTTPSDAISASAVVK